MESSTRTPRRWSYSRHFEVNAFGTLLVSLSMASTKSGSKKARAAQRRRQAQRNRLWIRIGLGLWPESALLWCSSSHSQVAIRPSASPRPILGIYPSLTATVVSPWPNSRAKPTVAAFFASWCTVCQRELPGFARLSLVIGDQVNFVGINTMNNGSGLPFARQAGIDHWPLARDVGQLDGRQLAMNFGARGSPTTVIYDETGNVADVTLGGMTAGQLAAKIDQFFGISS